MWNVLGSLISSFLLLRDLFGYAIPGSVLLAIVGYFGVTNASKLPLAGEPSWLKAIVVVIVSYVVGHVLAAIGYAPSDIMRWVKKRSGESAKKDDEKAVEVALYRYLYPSIFIEADRRETLTILRICLAVALIVGAWFAAFPTWPAVAFLVIGVIMLVNAYWSLSDAKRYSELAVAAAKDAEKKHVPYFNWSGGSGSAKSE